ncbi:MAG: RDD family protein [Myxococcales bacterium]|nr:RDD family protein [Myxococcales bacterium]
MNEAREELRGWVWVGFGGVATVLLPFWALLTAVVIQLNPDLAGFGALIEADGTVILEEPSALLVLARGAVRAGGLLLLGLPLVGLLTGMGWASSAMMSARQRRERDDLDEAVRDVAVLRGVEMKVSGGSAGGAGSDERSGEAPAAAEATAAPAPEEAPPTREVVASDQLVAARPGPRVAAFAIDFALSWGIILPGIVVAIGLSPDAVATPEGLVVVAVLVVTLATLMALAFGQMTLLGRDGQSVGKRFMGLRIVAADGRPAGVVQGLLVRQVVFGLLCLMVPVVGWFLVPLVDGALVFTSGGSTLHDRLAGTRVVHA